MSKLLSSMSRLTDDHSEGSFLSLLRAIPFIVNLRIWMKFFMSDICRKMCVEAIPKLHYVFFPIYQNLSSHGSCLAKPLPSCTLNPLEFIRTRALIAHVCVQYSL